MLGVLPWHTNSFCSLPTFSLKSTSRHSFLVRPRFSPRTSAHLKQWPRIRQFVHPHLRGRNPTDGLASSITISVGAVAVAFTGKELDGAELDGAQSLCSADVAAFDGTTFDGTACDGTRHSMRR